MIQKLNEVFPTANSHLFSAFNNPLWINEFPDSSELDTYFYLRYGDRIASKFVKYYENTSGVVTGSQLVSLANVIYNMNFKKWQHLYSVYNAEYNPIENTDFTETISESTGNTRVIDSENSNTGSATTESETIVDNDTTNTGNVYGFDSTNAVGDNSGSGTVDDTTTAESTTSTSSSGTEDSTITDNGSHTSEHRKHGNIGVTEATVMLEHEVAFWKWSFIDQVCKDICDIIALSIY